MAGTSSPEQGREQDMARRGKTSPAEDIMDLVAMLPWWVGVVLALVSYLLLHSVASQQVVATTQPSQVGAMVTQTLWKTLAGVGQYILPILCLAGAGMSAWRRRARQNLVTDVAQSKATDVLDGMSWREFEMLVGEGFRLQGYQVVETGGGGADGGVDLVVSSAVQAVARLQGRRGRGAGALRRDGRQGRHRWLRGDLGPVHRRGRQLCEWPQCEPGRWAEAPRTHSPGQGRD